MAYARDNDRRRYHREYMRERRAWFKAHRVCTECGHEDALTMGGNSLCQACFERKHGHPPVVRIAEPKTRIWQKREIPKSEYYAHGLCAKCGGAPYIEGKRTCAECYEQTCRAAWLGRKSQGARIVTPPRYNTAAADAAYRKCLENRAEYLRRWDAEYGCERYEERASAKEQGARQEVW